MRLESDPDHLRVDQLNTTAPQTPTCTFCGQPLGSSPSCARCAEWVNNLDRAVPTYVYELARLYAERHLRKDFDRWLRESKIIAVIGLLMTLGIIGLTVNFAQDYAKSEIDKALQQSQAMAAEARRTIADVNESVEEADDAMEKVERLKPEVDALTRKTNAHLVRLNDDGLRRTANLVTELGALHQARVVTVDQLAAVLDAPDRDVALAALRKARVRLLSPFSLVPGQPTVVFAERVRLRWRLDDEKAGDSIGNVSYVVEWGPDPSFVAGTHRAEAVHNVLDVPVADAHGRTFWRVKARARDDEDRTQWSEPGEFELYTDTLDRVRSTGQVRIGISASYVEGGRFAYVDQSTKALTGLDIELAREIAQRLPDADDAPGGYQPAFSTFEWDGLLDKLNENRVDLVVSTVTIKEERAAQYRIAFSKPYFETHQALVADKNLDLRVLRALGRPTAAAQAGTTSVDVARSITGDATLVRSVASSRAAIDEVLAGRADLAVTDYPIAVQEAGGNESLQIREIAPEEFPAKYVGPRKEEYGIALRQGDQTLLTAVNRALTRLRKDRILEDLAARFGPGTREEQTAGGDVVARVR